jgi:hypothetical protein
MSDRTICMMSIEDWRPKLSPAEIQYYALMRNLTPEELARLGAPHPFASFWSQLLGPAVGILGGSGDDFPIEGKP